MDEVLPLPSALEVVQRTKDLIQDLELSLPDSSNPNFRERLETSLDHKNVDPSLQRRTRELLDLFEVAFGVTIP